MNLLVDSHTLYWMAAARTSLSDRALATIMEADELFVAAVTWYELALAHQRGRLELGDTGGPLFFGRMEAAVVTIPLSRQIAQAAAALEHEPEFPRDPADRQIYATAKVRDLKIVTADASMRAFNREICIW